MTITEANAVAALLRLIDGTYRGHEDALYNAIDYLAERAAKPLQLRIDVDHETALWNIDRLLPTLAADSAALDQAVAR